MDSEEQAIPRSTDYEEQNKFSSGKKKYHTWLRPQRHRKTQLIVLPGGADIVDIVPGERGPKSDINIWRERKNIFHAEQKFAGSEIKLILEKSKSKHKKPKKQELTEKQKE